MSVLRSMTWSTMDEQARRALCRRGLEAIFDDDLRAAIGRIIDDVRAHGDEAVCRALKDFDDVLRDVFGFDIYKDLAPF